MKRTELSESSGNSPPNSLHERQLELALRLISFPTVEPWLVLTDILLTEPNEDWLDDLAGDIEVLKQGSIPYWIVEIIKAKKQKAPPVGG